jgi:hypothetical protein
LGKAEERRQSVWLSAAEPLDPSVADGFSISPLFPAYVLGQAYLAAGDGARAGDQNSKAD